MAIMGYRQSLSWTVYGRKKGRLGVDGNFRPNPDVPYSTTLS